AENVVVCEGRTLTLCDAENVLVCEGPTFKLCDFGSASQLPTRDAPRSAAEKAQLAEHLLDVTTPAYRAPEMAKAWGDDAAAGVGADIWALGCVLFYAMFL
ncbi:hypothetical protein T484DRAFT_1761190, partial [Baffinella frigidus]